ncbi:MAG: ATP-binding cassette domain-containing protein [Candidatus Thiodiazotropha sp. (ex Ctena orbiculata)]|nr:ATP-binding cassette domain-containing protein [Candidatus Thiodiazotropha taylori]
MKQQLVLSVEGYSKAFSLHEQGTVIPSAKDVSLQVYSASLTALVGPTGAGKSSILKGIYRTYLATSGQLFYTMQSGEQVDLVQADEHLILTLRRNEIGFVTQFLHFLPRQPTELVVAQPLIQRGRPVEEALAVARDMLAAMNLPRRLWSISPATFSGGEKQRVNLARGLVARPRLLLLDEPTASLDPITCERVIRQIEELKKEGVAMLAIFHQPELVKRIADRVVELEPPLNGQTQLEDIA